jgi:hypothetical protein
MDASTFLQSVEAAADACVKEMIPEEFVAGPAVRKAWEYG